jgi:hypothetical protein
MPAPKNSPATHAFFTQLLACIVGILLLCPDGSALGKNVTRDGATPTRLIGKPIVEQIPPAAPQPADGAPAPAVRNTDITCPGLAALPPNASHTKDQDSWGSITIAQPKIWQFERVSALLDGLLRDVEGVSLADLTQLDPNAQNAAAVRFVQSALEVGVQYDQAAAVTNGIARKNYQLQSEAQTQRFEADNAYIQLLTQQRNVQTAQLLSAQNTVNSLQPLADAKTISTEQQQQLDVAKSRVASLTTSLASVNDSIGKASLSTLAAAPTLQDTSVQPPASGAETHSSLLGFGDFLSKLPQGVQDNLSASLKAPSLPATKRLDNFMTLLYERLSREVSVLQDDLVRNPDNVAYLLQFDVGLYPSKKATDHTARVEFQIDCPGCKVYSLYPGQSSYNIGNFSASSKRTTLWGNFLTLIGFGASASYRRQQDQIQGSLIQSVYTAGFQDGLNDDPDPGNHSIPDGASAIQKFGWYYGAAPFERTVTPGIRSTFALVTVPRDSIDNARDVFGNSSACLPFHVNGAWAKNNNPEDQRTWVSPLGRVGRWGAYPLYVGSNKQLIEKAAETDADHEPSVLGGIKYLPSVIRKSTSVKLPAASEELSLVARREKDKLHIVRMEYNTVYAEAVPAIPPLPVVPALPLPSPTATPAAPAAKTPPPAPPASPAPPLDQFAPCLPRQCAGMLLRLDRPIDPNLVVTVRSEPLKRVRDSRGRATSILPATQSGSDISAQLNSAALTVGGNLLLKAVQIDRSLLESDKVEPNSWFPLNSNELFLNISKDLATDDEFPVIQITDPSGTIVVPHDLSKGSTELIINGLRMRPQSRLSVERELLRTYASEQAARAFQIVNAVDCPPVYGSLSYNKICRDSVEYVELLKSKPPADNAPITAGPYPYSTYIPLFLPDTSPQRLYARVGETSEDILIGFLPHQPGEADGPKSHKVGWREGHTQVILEDRDLDFAWSLSCYVQGDELACHLPRPAIQQVYKGYATVCPTDLFCPGAKESARPLQDGILNIPEPGKSQDQVKALLAAPATPPTLSYYKQVLDFTLPKFTATNIFRSLLNRAYVPTLQVWVNQSDTDENQVFYNAEPARIDFFPLSEAYWSSQTPFVSWRYQRATPNDITVEGCNYINGDLTGLTVRLLGAVFSKVPPRVISAVSDQPGCMEFTVPTIGLTRSQLVFNIRNGNALVFPTPFVLPTYKLAPQFLKPLVKPVLAKFDAANTLQRRPTSWVIDFPTKQVLCGDTVEWPENLVIDPTPPASGSAGKINQKWLQGVSELPACSVGTSANSTATKIWEEADSASRVHLRLTIPMEAIPNLPEEINLVRRSDNGTVVVATLPSLRRLLLPTQLSIYPLSDTQFALRGENSTVISGVVLQNGSTVTFVPAASGVDFSLVSLPAAKDDASTATDKTAAGAEASSKTIVTKSKDSTHVEVTESSKPAPPAKPSTPAKPPKPDTADANASPSPKALAPGTYTILPLVQIGQHTDEKTKKTIPDYLPLTVTDHKGKPLVFTIPEPKKPAAATPNTPATTTCTAPCVVPPCVTNCVTPPAAKP